MPTLVDSFAIPPPWFLICKSNPTLENPVNKSNMFLNTAIVAALVAGVPALHADKGHDHSQHAHPASDSAKGGAAMSSHDGMTALYLHLGEMETELAAGSLEGIHGHDENIRAAVRDLDKDTTLTAEKKKRVQGYGKNVLKLTGKIHVSADGKNLDQARKDFAKLQAQVDLLDKQFGHSHKPGAADKAKTERAHDHAEK